ncbi:M57 family metalloprotease [Terrabacter carboxydivorans]|uniref:Peptidase M10 metallopeptidase domain-containing protein n=1 Tax=Terrabacter carboxydivorans TaxID=619730 RepID=A0ABP5YVT8_9MICO
MKRIIFVVLAAVGLAVGAAAPSQAAKPAPTATAAYWGHWATQALVYDATGGNNSFKVPEAVSEWSKSGWNVVMTTDATKANITVVAENSTVDGAVGDATLVTSGSIITGCTVHLSPTFTYVNVGEHMAIHELGHCGGLPHSTSTKSVMYPTTNSNTMMTKPSAQDIRWMAGNY